MQDKAELIVNLVDVSEYTVRIISRNIIWVNSMGTNLMSVCVRESLGIPDACWSLINMIMNI